MKFLHFTSWNVTELKIDCKYDTRPWKISHYWKQKLTGDWEKQQMHSSGIPQLDKLMQHGKYAAELLKEYIFEEIRQERFSNHPSRKTCMFLFDADLSVDEFAKNINFNPSNYSLIEILPSEDSHFLRADLSHLNCNLGKYNDIVLAANEYWNGVEKSSLQTEILFEGEFVVSKIIREKQNT